MTIYQRFPSIVRYAVGLLLAAAACATATQAAAASEPADAGYAKGRLGLSWGMGSAITPISPAEAAAAP